VSFLSGKAIRVFLLLSQFFLQTREIFVVMFIVIRKLVLYSAVPRGLALILLDYDMDWSSLCLFTHWKNPWTICGQNRRGVSGLLYVLYSGSVKVFLGISR